MNSEFDPKSSEMSPDAVAARGIIADTFDLTPGRRSIVIGLAIAALKRVERALPPEILRSRPRAWTERRVRAIVDEEARRIDAYEIEDLKRVALAEARHEFVRSTERAAWLATLLSNRDPDFHSPEIALQEAIARGLGRTGTRLAAGPESGSGAATDRGGEQPRRIRRPGNRVRRAE